ncbi:hemagglutinin repeat-containing protein [Chromobacterium aquaticum]|uniref:two-partner secretion domain-containing protein n=1 Tax=Chromobacterium aquaticum TaxID=467180 RepID=UPI001E47A10C|nr:hemagglutinin repeat-containing protein [Chromobacterium aquaticum]MCD5360615.1 hemagglutinin repeat-containing protein [Chromobacterium aquaticum]
MNKSLYRIIFNQARGQLMAVQETASGQGKGSGRGQNAAGAKFAAARGFGFKLCALWVGVSLGSAALAADIVADPGAAAGQRPTVIQANNGLPVVQIATPSAAGVSHNQYQQFNVGPKGAVLNNSAQVVNTQLAGYVGGNPNLAGGSARIILNEVTHANPSQLNGYLEVAGQRAQVVVANPWGISCSGCGFINTQQAMLSTGTPQLNAQGALTGFQVNGGVISIGGAGLSAGNVDKFAIISRALQVNAEFHAKQLELVLGRNQVDADTLQARPLAADGGTAPAFALDVAQLGGMYANAIRLVGTEMGVGVRQQGEMAARAGDLQLTSAGDLVLKGKTFSQQDIKLNSGGKLEHSGQTRSQGALQVAATDAAQLEGSLTAGGALGLEAATVAGKGSVAAGAHADGKLGEAGALTLRSRAGLDFHGELLAGGDVNIQAGSAQLQGAAVGASHGDLRVTVDGELNASQAKLGAKNLARLQTGEDIKLQQGALSAGQLELQARALDNRGGLIAQSGEAAGSVRLQGVLDNRDGVISSQGKTLSVEAAAIDNRHGEISHAGADTLRVSVDKIDNREQGKLHSDAKAEVKAAEIDNAQGRLTALQGLELNASGVLRNDGLLGSDGQLKLTAGQLENGVGLIQAGKDLQLTAASVNNADKGQILALGKESISSLEISGQLNNQGKIAGNAALDVNAADIDNHGGSLQSATQLNLNKQASLNNDGGHIVAKDLNLKADTLSNQGGEVFAQQQLDAELQQLNNAKGSLIGSQKLNLTTSASLHNDGLLGSDGQLKLTVGQLENGVGLIQAGKDLQLTAASVNNADKGQILALGKDAASSLEISGQLNNQGKIAGNAALDVNAADIDNHGGSLQSAAQLNLNKQVSLNNDGGHIVAMDLGLKAATLSNQGGEVFAQQQLDAKLQQLNNTKGSLIGSQKLNLTASASLHNDGLLGSDGQLKLTAGALENGAGLIQAGKDLQLTAASVNNADKGQILALGKDAASSLEISGQLNNQGKIAGNAALDVNAADIDNHGGSLQSADKLSLNKQTSLNNDGGHIVAMDLGLKAETLSNQGGEVFAQQQLDAKLQQLNNAKGSLIGSQKLNLTASASLHNDGLLGSDGQFKLTVGQLENGAGLIQAGKDLQLTAASVNNAGQILALGKESTSSLEISGQLNNQGKIAGNAGLDVNAADIDNHRGSLQSADKLSLNKQASLNNDGGHIVAKDLSLTADTLSNQGGEVFAQQALDAKLQQLNNAKGSLIGSQKLNLTTSTSLHNDGLLGSDGQLKLTVGQLENGAGLIQAGKDLQLTAVSVNNADKGQILALGKDAVSSLEISGQLNNQGKIAGNAALDINAADIDNHGGSLQSADKLSLNKQASLNNDGGHIVAKDLSLKAETLSNQGGEVFAQQQLDAKLQQLNNAKGSLIGSQKLNLTASASLHNDGLLGSDGQLKLTAGALENGAGLIQAGKDLQLTAASVNNADKGQILALGKDTASSLEISGQLNNQGKIAGNAGLDVNAADIDNHGGSLQSADKLNLNKQASLNNDGGHIVAKDLSLKADTLSNQGGEVFAQQALDAQLSQLNNTKGSLIGSQGLTLSARETLHNDGLLGSDGQLKLTVGQLENGVGLIQAGKDLQLMAASVNNADKGQILALGKDAASSLEISGQLHNQGKIAGNAGLDVNAADIDNHGGSLQSADKLNLNKQASLNNDGGHIVAKDLSLTADTLSNQGGEVFAQQALDAQLSQLNNAKGSLIGSQSLSLSVGDLLRNDGLLGSDGQLKLTAGQLENGAGLIQAGKDLQLTAASVSNADKGQILALGKDAASSLEISGQLNNQGKIAGNAGLDVNAADIDNHGGSLQSADKLSLNKQASLNNDGGHVVAKDLSLKANTLSNQGGEVFAQQQLDAKLQQLNNAKGSLIGSQKLNLTTSTSLHNDGLLGSDGQLKLTAGQLENGTGLIQAGKDLQLTAASVNNAGQILALGKDAASSLEISGQLNNQGKIAGNAALDVNAADIDNHGGSLQSADKLNLNKQASLNNDGGHIVAMDLGLKVGTLSNQGGEIRHLGQTMAQWLVRQRLDNQQGTLFSNGGLTLAAQSLNNQQGTLSSLGAQSLQLAQGLDNQGGTLAGGQGLQLQLGAVLNNQGGTVQAESLQVHAAGLGNQGGSIKALGSGGSSINIGGTLDNSAQGVLAGNGRLEVSAAALDNRQGLLQSAAALDVQVAWLAQNQGGKIQAEQLQLKASELNNQQGLLSQASDGVAKLELSGKLDNSQQGKVLSNGQLRVTAADLLNVGGTFSSQSDLQLSVSGTLDNRQGALGSNGALKLDSASVDNAGGLLQAGHTLTLDSGSLLNQGGRLLALGSGDSRVTLGGQLNNGGQIAGNGDWRIKAQGLDNAGGSLLSVGNLSIDAVTLGNSGSFLAGKDLNLTLANDFIHTAGSKLEANGKLSISSSGNLINSGQLQAGGDLALNGVSWTNSGEVNAGGKLSTELSQALSNSGKLSAGTLQLNAASVLNTHSITGGDISIRAASLDNGGSQGLIASAGNMALDIGQTLNNHDGSWLYSQGDMRIGKAGVAVGQVINHVATMQADRNIDINVGNLTNEANGVVISQKESSSTETKPLQKFFPVWCEEPLGYGCNGLYYDIWRTVGTAYIVTNKKIDVVSEVAFPARILSGGDVIVQAEKAVNRYSHISAGGEVVVLSGSKIENIAQALYESSTIETKNYYGDPKNGNNSVSVQVVPAHQIGSIDAVISAGQNLTLRSPSIVNDKIARLDIAAASGSSHSTVAATSRVSGQTLAVDPDAAKAVELAASGVGSQVLKPVSSTRQLAGTHVDSAFGQVLPSEAAATVASGGALRGEVQAVAGDGLSKAVPAPAQGKTLQGEVTTTSGAGLGGGIDTAHGQVLSGKVHGDDASGRTLSAGDISHVAATVWSGAKAAVLPQQVLLESAGTKAANPVADGYSLPNNGLFQTRPAPTQPYLVETDPRFTQYGNFISSDYLLKQLGYDPSRVEKRLGDGFYEQQLVSRAVTELTGKRFIGGNANATQQYQQLMSQGAEYAKQFQLTPGVALSAEQMSRLTADMVWLVKQNVDGHDVLVPVVYLAKAQEQSLRGQGAVLAGSHMELLADGALINSGTLKAGNSLLAQAGDIRIEGGKVLAGGDLGLGARHNLSVSDDKQHSQAGSVIQAGSLQLLAGNDLKLQAVQLQVNGDAQLQAGHDLDIASRENRYDYRANTGRSQYSYQQVDHVGSTLQVGGSLGFNAGNDLTFSGAEVKAGGKLLAVAGNELTLQSTLDSKQGQGSWNGWGWGAYSTLDQIRHATQLQAGGDMLLQAGGNLALNGSQAQAGGNLLALAGKQLTVQSEVNSRQDRLNVQMGSKGYGHSWQTDSLAVAGLASQGNLQLQAGGDAVLNGASLGSHSALTLSAGQDIRLGAVATQSRSDNYYTNGDIHNNYDLSQHGSALSGTSGLTLNAGRDITSQAASLGSDGQATLLAGRDITLGSAENRHSDYHKTVRSSGGAFSRKTTVDISAHDNTTQIGSTVSADKIAMQSGQDLNIQASQVAGSGTVSLMAGRDLNIRSGTDTQRVFQFHQEKTTGVFSGGGIGFTVGSKELTQEMNGAGSTQSQNRSLVGSINGDLQLKAGGVLTLQGSDVTAGGNLLVDAKKQQLDAAVDTWHSVQKTTSKSSGLTVQITSPLISGLQAAAAATDTLLSSKDNRVKALSAATAGLAGYNSYTAYQQAMAGADPSKNGYGVKLSISVGGSQSESTTVSDSHTESGSLLKAGGNLFTQAAGAGQDSTITGHGAQLLAGKDLTIKAEGAISLLAAQSRSSEHTTSTSSSGGVGVSLGLDSKEGVTYGFSGNASYSRGKVDGKSTQNQLSQLNAGGKLDIQSGGDFTLQGEARGQQVVGVVAGDLRLESLQDTSSYHSLNQSVSGNASMSGGSVSLSQQKMDADYASVQQQSGIKAGDGGFQLSVKGSTQLTGAVIAGSAASIQQGKNSLSTGALVTKDIDNHADFTASSVTVTAGSGGVTGMAMAASDHDASTTRSGISGGKLEISNPALQQALTGQSAADAVAKLNRNVDSATDGSGKLANNFDKEQVQALFDAAAALHEQVGTFLSNKAQAAKATQDALDAARKDPAASVSDLERLERAAADTKADADKWAPGGAYGQILTAVTAGIGGNLANGLGGMAQNAGIAYLQGLGAQQVKALVDGMEGGAKTPEGETVRAVLHAALACGGASASGQNCGAGAAGAAAAVALNSALDQLQKTDASKMTAAEKLQRENLVNGLLAGLSTATGGGSTAATTVNAAKTELENNQFGDSTVDQYLYAGKSRGIRALVEKANQKGSSQGLVLAAAFLTAQGTPAAIAAARACMSNPLCLNELAITLGEFAAGDALPSGLGGAALVEASRRYVRLNSAGQKEQAKEVLKDISKLIQDFPVSTPTVRYLDNASAPEVRGRLLAAVKSVRREFADAGNAAFAEVNIPALSKEPLVMKAFSRYDEAWDEFIPKPSGDMSSWILKPQAATVKHLNSPMSYLRDSDTEFKILENIAQKLGPSSNVSGTINLLSEKAVCPSCRSVVDQFRLRYPNIKLNVFTE